MRRDIFTEEHEMFRAQVRRLVETEIEPKIPQWNRDGISDRESLPLYRTNIFFTDQVAEADGFFAFAITWCA